MTIKFGKTTYSLGNGPRYFRSFMSYEIPFRPDMPVKGFAETEGLASFYRAYFDSEGRVCQFDKLLMVGVENEGRKIELCGNESPESAIYLQLVRDPQTGESGVGKKLTYPETEQLGEFFAGEVDSSGQTCRVVPFRKDVVFSDTYDFWPSGRLRTRTTAKNDGSTSIAHFNEKGRAIAAPTHELQATGAALGTQEANRIKEIQ